MRITIGMAVLAIAGLLGLAYGGFNNIARRQTIQVSAGSSSVQGPSAGKLAVGGKAPAWQVKTLDGKKVALADFTGKKGVVVAFFATWCPHCMEEVPDLIAFQNKIKDAKVELVALALDQPERVLTKFVDSRKVNYVVANDADGVIARAYGVVGIPTIIGIDAQGTVRYIEHALPREQAEFVKLLEPAMPSGAAQP